MRPLASAHLRGLQSECHRRRPEPAPATLGGLQGASSLPCIALIQVSRAGPSREALLATCACHGIAGPGRRKDPFDVESRVFMNAGHTT